MARQQRTDKNLGGTRIGGKVPAKTPRSYESHPGGGAKYSVGPYRANKTTPAQRSRDNNPLKRRAR